VAKNPPAQVSKEGPDSSLTKADKTARKAGPAEIAENDPPAKTADTPPDVKTKPSMALVKAERYLQGRGVPQNCEQGLMYLKAATEENDPKAAVEMGALYSSGLCVQQDRVQAYKWFSSARDLEPGNRWIDKNMSQLWAQMTSEERRRARGTL
jgi:TPR repeat protein